MKIGTNIGMSKSPDAATFETGPAYEYSFAMDFSKLTVDDVNVGTTVNTNFPSVTATNRFISVAAADVLAGGDGILLEMSDVSSFGGNIGFPGIDNAVDATDENLVKLSFTSSSSDGIPNGSISDVYRYVSLVMTYHSQNSLGASLTDDNNIGTLDIHDAGDPQKKYGGPHFHGTDKGGSPHDYPRFINGVDITVDFDSSGRDRSSGLLTSGTDEFDIPLTLTWDMADAVALSDYSALTGPIDPAELKYQLGGGKMAVTFHGFIFSKQVPGAVTLPIHTSRPDAAFA